MATPRKKQPVKSVTKGPFLREWMEDLGVGDAELGDLIGEDRTTIWKWQEFPTRFNPEKQARAAKALGISPALLWLDPREHTTKLLRAFLSGSPPEDIPKIKP